MCNTSLHGILPTQSQVIGKKVTIHPRNGETFKGKVSSVDRDAGNAIIETVGGTKSVALGTAARPGW